jgi:hypothetical protein
MNCDQPLQFTITGERPFERPLAHIPDYVIRLASKGRGVRCHYNSFGKAKRQTNYVLYKAQ